MAKTKQTVQDAPGPLRLAYIDPGDLEGNPANWREHPAKQTQALADVIGEVGWAGALLYNERTSRLIDGHARKELFAGKGPVPVLIGDWSEADERKILASLDPIAAMATANAGQLDSLLREVATGSESLAEMFADMASEAAEQAIADMANTEPKEDEGGVAGTGDTGYKQFAVPLTIAQEQLVRRGIKEAKASKGAETSGEALYFIVQEWLDARSA